MNTFDNLEPKDITPEEPEDEGKEAEQQEDGVSQESEEPQAEEPEPQEGGEGGEEGVEPEKFKDKSREEVIKSYVELEKLRNQDIQGLDKKAEEKAKELAEKEREGTKKEVEEARKSLADVEKQIVDEIEKTDFGKMDPKEFAKYIITKQKSLAERIAEDRARETYSKESSVREKVRTEIGEVGNQYPILKEKSEKGEAFRDLVLNVVSAEKSKGKVMGLKEAVEKVMKITGTGAEKKETKKPKAVEKTVPAGVGEERSEEQKIQEGIINAGSKSGGLGGL